ncbi:MAG: TRAP transporter substrate-binding protein [Rhodobacter sp.]|uniref:TRAP transporter substrate-binding protein n=1 Tax=Pararhodobacter sp. TaxID=2127056 RepID=UPI001D5C870E|nr:TRAP transporter substrate-binding protein [Pararhodobacter sp.]MCB1344646.1 TRAP transporter substrate-binding protein [Paracoccaceae bacterium]MCC0071871.1 TRAP transporter substrate-binding protein [Rhodobacter sp.]HPD92598.1 TRAP transporter substrate-binding protein [Pararhodobacter sp.]
MTKRRTVLGLMGAAAAMAVTAGTAQAQEYTLRMHQFLPAQANVPHLVLDVWADNVERDSGGRIRVERYASMALGGTPPELMDQVMDGVADIVWTVNGYTPGRFPQTEVFELPFFVADARAASSALWQMYQEHMQEDFAGVHMLGMWVHGPGIFHTSTPVRHPSDLQGMKIRGGSRGVNDLLGLVGAEAIGLPVPAIPESLQRGVIDGTTIPWEVTTSLHVAELVHNHTEFEGPGLYTLTFSFAMNQDAYDNLPADLQEVIDRNSGLEFSIFAGGTQADADGPARQVAVDAGNNIITIPEADAQEWRDVVAPLYETWTADMADRGIDGQALIDEARQLMADYEAAH